VPTCHLDLTHSRSRSTLSASQTSKASTRLNASHDQAGGESCKEEPHERCRGLDLPASLLIVPGAAKGDPSPAVAIRVDAAAVWCTEFGGKHNSGDERENDGKAIEDEENDRDGERGDDCGDATEQDGDPAPGGGEHGVVDGGLATVDVGGDDVADQGGDEEEPEKGESPQGKLDKADHGGWVVAVLIEIS